jgi:hypothetical protein
MGMSKKDAMAALTHLATGEDDTAKMAKALLAVFGSGEDEKKDADGEDEPHKEPDGDEAKASEEPDGDEKKEDKKASEDPDDKKEDTKANRVNVMLNADLKARLEKMEAERKAEKEAAERKTLLASRTITSKDARVWLETKATIEEVRAACKVLPPAEAPNPAAALSVQATSGCRSNAQPKRALTLQERIDAKMGIAYRQDSVRYEGDYPGQIHILGPLVGEDGRAEIDRIKQVHAARKAAERAVR